MENTIGITLETGVRVQSAILHICQLSFQVPGVIGSVLGLVGHVFVYCDWLR